MAGRVLYYGAIITDGLVLQLDPKAYTSGNTWNDISGNNNHATLQNGVSFLDLEYYFNNNI